MNLAKAMDIVEDLQEEYEDLDIGLDRCFMGPDEEDNYQITIRSKKKYSEEKEQRKIAAVLLDKFVK